MCLPARVGPFAAESRRVHQSLGLLYRLLSQLNNSSDLSAFLNTVAQVAASSIGHRAGLVMLLDADNNLSAAGSYGLSQSYVAQVALPHYSHTRDHFSPIRDAWEQRRPVLVPDIDRDPRLGFWTAQAHQEGIRSMATFPITEWGQPLGILNLYCDQPHAFADADLVLADGVCDLISAAVATVRMLQEHLDEATALREEISMHNVETHAAALLDAALDSPTPLDDIVQTVGATFAGSALLLSESGHTLAFAGEPPDRELLSRHALAQRSGGPTTHHPEPLSAPEVVVVPVAGASATLARLCARPAGTVAPDAVERVARRAALTAALALLDLDDRVTSGSAAGQVLLQLFQRRCSEPSAILDEAAEVGLDLTIGHHMILVELTGGPGSAAQCADLLQAQIAPRHTGLISSYGSYLVLLLPARSELTGEAENHLVEEIQRACRALGPENGPILLFGETAPDGLADNYDLAQALVAKIGDHRRSDAAVVDVRRWGVYRLLLQSSSSEHLQEVFDRTLGRLLAYDESRGTPLVDTIASFLAHDMSPQAAAKDLSVHVNTLAYRLRRIEEILGINTKSPGDLLDIQFALHIRSVLQCTLAGRATN